VQGWGGVKNQPLAENTIPHLAIAQVKKKLIIHSGTQDTPIVY
jgi:hypothetical protein